MECQRCKGLMVQDRAYDLQDTILHCDVWRCVCCGNMFDKRMLMNRNKLGTQVQPQKQYSLLEVPEAA